MNKSYIYRINGFEQIKAFYSWVFNNADRNITPQHISLYLFFVNQNNRNNWVEWFKCPYDLAMAGACLGSKRTYYACLKDLSDWKLIEYKKGINEWRAPLIRIEVLNHTSTDNAGIPQSEPQLEQQPNTLPIKIYKLLTANLKTITDNYDKFEEFVHSLRPLETDLIDLIIKAFAEEFSEINQIEYVPISKGKERAAAGKILAMHKKKKPSLDSSQTLEGLRHYFGLCVRINDDWLRNNMSLPLIVSKFNEINNILKNGNKRTKTGNGVSNEELAGITAKHFAQNRE